jgi:hypothetical protein
MVYPLSNEASIFQRMLDHFKGKENERNYFCSEIISLDPPIALDFVPTQNRILGSIVCIPEAILIPKRCHGENPFPKLRFMPQTINNTCGTLAMINFYLNLDYRFETKSENEILDLHNENLEFQESTSCIDPRTESEETELHFIALLAVAGDGIYEIDGRNPAGIRQLASANESIFNVIHAEYASASLGNMSAILIYE